MISYMLADLTHSRKKKKSLFSHIIKLVRPYRIICYTQGAFSVFIVQCKSIRFIFDIVHEQLAGKLNHIDR